AALLHTLGLDSPDRRPTGNDPWAHADGWRVGGVYTRDIPLADTAGARVVHLTRDDSGWRLAVDDAQAQALHWSARGASPAEVRVRLGDTDLHGSVFIRHRQIDLFADGERHTLSWEDPIALAEGQADERQGGLSAPMPG